MPFTVNIPGFDFQSSQKEIQDPQQVVNAIVDEIGLNVEELSIERPWPTIVEHREDTDTIIGAVVIDSRATLIAWAKRHQLPLSATEETSDHPLAKESLMALQEDALPVVEQVYAQFESYLKWSASENPEPKKKAGAANLLSILPNCVFKIEVHPNLSEPGQIVLQVILETKEWTKSIQLHDRAPIVFKGLSDEQYQLLCLFGGYSGIVGTEKNLAVNAPESQWDIFEERAGMTRREVAQRSLRYMQGAVDWMKRADPEQVREHVPVY